MIRFNNVSKTYTSKTNNTQALQNVSFELPSVGFIGLSGENGCGKTTLLNLLSTVDNDFDGSITIDNLDVKKDATFIRKNVISYVFQENFFVDELNASENVEIFSNEKPSIKDQKEFNLLDQINKKPNELSGGQKQKVSLLRGLLRKSLILIVDEPTSSLDENTTKKVFEILSEISKSKLVILVSHDMEMMNAYCNIIIRLKQGNLEYIKSNNTVSDVEYIDDSAIFYGDINLHSISLEKMNESIKKNGYFKIVKIDKNQIINKDNYYINQWEKDEYIFSSNQRKLLFKSYLKASFKKIISFVLVCTLLLLCFEIFYDFQNFNKNDFYYETLSKNSNSDVIIKQDVLNSEDGLIEKTEIEYIRNNYNTYVDSAIKNESELLYPFDYDDFFLNRVSNIVYTDFNHYEFLCGSAPNGNNKIVLTDYIADAVIKFNINYSTYKDICDKGITLNDQNILVSGIIKTDYKEYYESKNNFTDQQIIDFEIKKDKIYSCVYCDFLGNNNIPFVVDSSLSIVFNIDFDSTIDNVYGKLNRQYANEYGYDGLEVLELKTSLGLIYVYGIIDDESDDYIIYYPTKYSTSVSNIDSYDYYMLNISNRDVFNYLQENDIAYLSYAYQKAENAYVVINILKTLFLGLMIVILSLLTINTIVSISSIHKKNNNLYCLMKMAGLPQKELLLVELIIFIISIVLLLIFNGLIYFIGYKLLNNILMNAYSISISIFNSHVHCFIVSMVIQIIIYIIVYIVKMFIRNKQNIRKLIK